MVIKNECSNDSIMSKLSSELRAELSDIVKQLRQPRLGLAPDPVLLDHQCERDYECPHDQDQYREWFLNGKFQEPWNQAKYDHYRSMIDQQYQTLDGGQIYQQYRDSDKYKKMSYDQYLKHLALSHAE
jgi:hypothetical protein